MSTYHITGQQPLFGSVRVGGAKNASFKLMIAALLANSPSRLLNFSHISDVKLVADMISSVGAIAKQTGDRAYMIDPQGFNRDTLDAQFGQGARASTFFLPIFLHKFGHAVVPLPGGDKIGQRALDWHFEGLSALGADIKVEGNQIVAQTTGLKGAHYTFPKNSHTGTETLILAACCAQGTTVLENAAQETEVDDLIKYLNFMGAHIQRTSPRTIQIEGTQDLHGAIFKIMPDQNQVVSFACAALATKGDVIVENARAKDLESFLTKLDEIKAGYEISQYGIRFFYKEPLVATDVTTAIAPGFKTDWQPLWVTMMTQAQGVSTLHETIHQNRFSYTEALNQMGAKIELFNPPVTNPEEVYNFKLDDPQAQSLHAARITGPTALTAGEFEVKDLRHGATLMIAGLIAQGETIIHDPEQHIDRGYEMLDAQFSAMGAQIRRST